MRIATWNINSLRLRMNLVKKLSEEINPDIICFQETKVNDPDFPLEDLKSMGYNHVYFKGEKSYNGVATASRFELGVKEIGGFGGNEDKRHLLNILPNGEELHNFYVPAGGDEPDPIINPKFAHKLRFMDEMIDHFGSKANIGKKMIILGDFNIAPFEHDVWSHRQLLSVVSHTQIEVDKMDRLYKAQSFVDVSRKFTPHAEKLYSWWSYRSRDWEKSNRGRRLDHIWVTPNLDDRVKSSMIYKDTRNWERPSDHVPVVLDLS